MDSGSSADWIGCVYRHLRAQFVYELGFTPYYFHCKTRSRAMMPVAVKQGSSVLGVYPLFDLLEPRRSELTSARNFLASYPNSKMVFVKKGRTDPKMIHENAMTLSAAHAFY